MTLQITADDPIRAAVDAVLEDMGPKVYLNAVTDSDGNPMTVAPTMPYLLRTLVLPFDTHPRVGGRGPWVFQFMLQYAHWDGDGCRNVILGVRDYLEGRAVVVGDRTYRLHLSDPSSNGGISRDDTWKTPDGKPTYYAWDRWNVL